MNATQILTLIDIFLVVVTVLFAIVFPFYQTAKVHGFKNIGKEEFRQMVLGYCYGYSRAVKHGVYSDGKVRWTRLLLNIAVVAAFAWLGLIAYATMQVLMVLVAIPMYYAPEPELSAFDKMAIDVQIAISIP